MTDSLKILPLAKSSHPECAQIQRTFAVHYQFGHGFPYRG